MPVTPAEKRANFRKMQIVVLHPATAHHARTAPVRWPISVSRPLASTSAGFAWTIGKADNCSTRSANHGHGRGARGYCP